MKHLIKSTLILAAMATSVTTTAMAAVTDSQYLAQCKEAVNAQFDAVSDIDVASMKSRRNTFKAKLRVTFEGQRSVLKCNISDGGPVALVCLKGNACKTASVATQ